MRLGSMCCPHCQKWHPSSEPCRCDGATTAMMKPFNDALNRAAEIAKLKSAVPSADQLAFMDEAKALIRQFEHLDPMHTLAIASQLVGNLIALQDQTKVTPAMAMEVVAGNIEIGNAAAIETFLGSPAGAA